MICPCFDMTFIGFCAASPFPYIPSVPEKQRHCFSERFSDCAIFAQHQAARRPGAEDRPLEVNGLCIDQGQRS